MVYGVITHLVNHIRQSSISYIVEMRFLGVNTFFNIDSVLALGKWNLADIGTKMYSHNGSVIYQVWHILEIFALSMD